MKQQFFKHMVGGFLLGACLINPLWAADSLKIGVVDFAQVFEKVPQGRATLEALKKALEPQLDSLKNKQQSIAEAVKIFRRDAPTMAESTRHQKEQELLDRQQDFEKEVTAMRETEMGKEQVAAKAFDEKVTVVVQDLGRAESYDLILNKQVIPFAKENLEITDRVIEKMKK